MASCSIQTRLVLSLFRRNLFINLIFLALLAIALLAYHFVVPAQVNTLATNSIFGDLFNLQERSTILMVSFSIILILIQAYLINDIVIKHKLSRALSTIPAAVFILFSAWVMSNQIYHPILIANTFFILSLNSLFKVYKKFQPIINIFNSGFWLALSTCFYTPYLLFLIVLLLGLLSLRNINVRETLQMLIGLLTPFFLMGTVFFYFDMMDRFSPFTQHIVSIPQVNWENPITLAKPILLILLILISIFFNSEIKKKKKFDAIKKIELAYWTFLVALFSVFFGNPVHEMHLLMASVPIGLCYGLVLESSSNKIIKEFMFLLAVGGYGLFLLGLVG